MPHKVSKKKSHTHLLTYLHTNLKKAAFTLAEVLITLTIIGIAAALSLPALINKYQEIVLKNQFKKTYSVLNQAWQNASAEWGSTPDCWYWEKFPYKTKCIEFFEGSTICKNLVLSDGSPLPSDFNGQFRECSGIKNLFYKNLKIIKICNGNSVTEGCMPEYKTMAEVKKENNPDISDISLNLGCPQLNKINSLNSYVLADGVIIFDIFHAILGVDVNGKKGPNKWGYDVFDFTSQLYGSNRSGQIRFGGMTTSCTLVEKGGMSTMKMLQNFSMK